MMEKSGREQHSLGTIAEGKHQMVPLSSSSAGGSLLSQLILLRAAIDGDLRLFKEMVLCLDKGQGGAATVAAVSYKGVGALHIAVRMGRTLIMEYLEHELGLDTTGIIDNSGHLSEKLSLKEHIDHIIHEIISQLPQAQEHKSITMQTPILSWEDLQSDMIREIACAFSSAEIPFLLLPPMELTKPYTIWKLRNRNSPACDACERIMLPSLWALYGKFVDSSKLVRHAVLSSDPSFSNCWLILVFLTTDDSSFFSYRYGSHGWTQHMHEECVAEDVVYFVDRFVALTEDGRLALLCVDAADPPVQFVDFEEKLPEGRRYLVVGSSEQELLLVTTSDLDSPQVRLPLHNHHSGISSHEGKESHGSSGNQMQLNSQFAAKAQIQDKKVSETHSEREKVD
ncbi:hypothetical protein EJB05_20365 [Eragrostis curvula]|uniref:KIB1-4 beta-propeller domain-containing protein n=1 Tax=Eragrostis curvula TaxID=38414 RepID=A0A5J9V0J6_9POAL|nr:hypothetical protein EJB05_20365 [Eragrostis curvula]